MNGETEQLAPVSEQLLHRVQGGRGKREGGGMIGALDGGPPLCMSNLKNGNVPCPYFCNIHVDFKIVACRMSNLRNCPCHVTNIFLMSMFHVACRF